MKRPTADELTDMVLKRSIREVKANLAVNSRRPLTEDEERVLQIGILTGSNAMLQELIQLDVFKEDLS